MTVRTFQAILDYPEGLGDGWEAVRPSVFHCLLTVLVLSLYHIHGG